MDSYSYIHINSRTQKGLGEKCIQQRYKTKKTPTMVHLIRNAQEGVANSRLTHGTHFSKKCEEFLV